MTSITELDWDELPDTLPATEEAIRKAQELRTEEELERLLNDWYHDEAPTIKFMPLEEKGRRR